MSHYAQTPLGALLAQAAAGGDLDYEDLAALPLAPGLDRSTQNQRVSRTAKLVRELHGAGDFQVARQEAEAATQEWLAAFGDDGPPTPRDPLYDEMDPQKLAASVA